ncbi:MAG: PocR ligand-binding domain-containing protein [Firmicutes bacterium]|nr:PocR ligand-binding domain-containing protein [Bacillota bacterium]
MNLESPLSSPSPPDVGTVIEHRTLSRLVRSFAIATGLGVNVLTPQGELVPMAGTGLHPFCRAVQTTKEGKARCLASLVKGGELAAQLGEPYIFRCHAGLIEWSAPVVVENQFLGSFSCGPALMWPLDELAIEEIALAVRDLGLGVEELKKLLAEVKVLAGPNVQAAAELLFVVSNHIAQTGLLTLMQRRELNEQQARLAELIGARKRKDEVLRELEAYGGKGPYPLEMERTLLGRVRLGDRTGAKEILNELLGEIFLKSGGDLEVMKARLLELLIVISRAAVEGGASLEKLFGVNYDYISRLSGIERFEDLCRWIVGALDTFMDTVYQVRRVKNAKLLGEATRYIRENYDRPLTLESVAQKVYVSPFYLSHLFKAELGLTFVEYLTRVRVEEAKRLLAATNLSVLGVAEKVGYEDASYFSKVFRKMTGMTPNQYRRSC